MNESIKDLVIGVDLGATNIRAGLVVNSNIISKSQSIVPANTDNANTVIESLKRTIDKIIVSGTKGIGIGIPSLVDRKKGIVYDVQNIPSWKTIYLKSILEDYFNIPVFLENDCNCFALGEKLYGQGNQFESFVGVTIGTGLGSGIINGGKLIHDANCGSGEFGSIPYLDGIYEDYCSGKFFTQFYNETGERMWEMARMNIPNAIDAFNKFGLHLGRVIKTIMFSIDPEAIIFGGSIIKAKPFFEKSMHSEIEKFPYKQSSQNLRILFSNLPNPGILGAAAMYFNAVNDYKYEKI